MTKDEEEGDDDEEREVEGLEGECFCPECNPDRDEGHSCEDCKDCSTCYESKWEHCGCSHPAGAGKTWTSKKTGALHRTREVTSKEVDTEFGRRHSASSDREKWIRVEHLVKKKKC